MSYDVLFPPWLYCWLFVGCIRYARMMLVNNHENWLYEYTLPLAYLHMRYPRYLVPGINTYRAIPGRKHEEDQQTSGLSWDDRYWTPACVPISSSRTHVIQSSIWFLLLLLLLCDELLAAAVQKSHSWYHIRPTRLDQRAKHDVCTYSRTLDRLSVYGPCIGATSRYRTGRQRGALKHHTRPPSCPELPALLCVAPTPNTTPKIAVNWQFRSTLVLACARLVMVYFQAFSLFVLINTFIDPRQLENPQRTQLTSL